MKKMVSIARALKEKNRIAGRLSKLRELVNKENSREKKIPRGIDVRDVYDESRVLKDRLVAVKSAIAVANQPIVGKIIELDEVKSEIAYMNNLNVREGVFEKGDYGRSVTEAYDAVIRKPELLERIAELQDRADELQDALDEFNASTKIEIEIGR